MKIIVAVLMIAIGGYLSFWSNQRAFNRRNMAGVEEFKSYGDSITKRGVEKIARIGGRLLLIFGVLSLIATLMVSGLKQPQTENDGAATEITSPAAR